MGFIVYYSFNFSVSLKFALKLGGRKIRPSPKERKELVQKTYQAWDFQVCFFFLKNSFSVHSYRPDFQSAS